MRWSMNYKPLAHLPKVSLRTSTNYSVLVQVQERRGAKRNLACMQIEIRSADVGFPPSLPFPDETDGTVSGPL